MIEQHSYSGDYTNRYKFNGKELDEETGFYYYGARFYNPKFSIMLSTDQMATKYPSMNPYTYCFNNPISLIDPTGMEPEGTDPVKSIFNIGCGKNSTKKFSATLVMENYKRGIAKEESDSATGKNKLRWQGLIGKDACALQMSYALNASGYLIPEHKSSDGRTTWTGGKKRSNNNNKPYEYILGADAKGDYLKGKLGTPTFHLPLVTDDNIKEFVAKVEKYNDFVGFIYINAKNQGESGFNATGHVDLIYEDWGNDAHVYGSKNELDDYLEWNDNDSWFDKDSKLEVFIWITEFKSKDK